MYVLRFISEIKKIKLKLNKVCAGVLYSISPNNLEQNCALELKFCKVHFENTTQLKQQSNCRLSHSQKLVCSSHNFLGDNKRNFTSFHFISFRKIFRISSVLRARHGARLVTGYCFSICGLREGIFFPKTFYGGCERPACSASIWIIVKSLKLPLFSVQTVE